MEERERRDEDAEEERDPAEARHGAPVDPPPADGVDDAQQPGHPADRRRQQDDDREGDGAAPDDREVVAERVEDALVHALYFVP